MAWVENIPEVTYVKISSLYGIIIFGHIEDFGGVAYPEEGNLYDYAFNGDCCSQSLPIFMLSIHAEIKNLLYSTLLN